MGRDEQAAGTQDYASIERSLLQHPHTADLGIGALPEWVPRYFRYQYCAVLECIIDNQDYELPEYASARDRDIARWIWRMVSYHPDMALAWEMILSGPLLGVSGKKIFDITDDQRREVLSELFFDVFIEQFFNFEPEPKTLFTPAQKKLAKTSRSTKLKRAANLCRELSALLDDPEVHGGVSHLKVGIDLGSKYLSSAERHSNVLTMLFKKADLPTDCTIDQPDNESRAIHQASLHHNFYETDLMGAMGLIAVQFLEAQENPKVIQSGSIDRGLRPYTIRNVSKLVVEVHAQPFDSAVALLVSAMLGLQEPLTRDDVRPYMRQKVTKGKKTKKKA